MNNFEKLIFFLSARMEEPEAFGWYHFMWLGFVVIAVCFLYNIKNKHNEKQLKIILGIYGIIALIFETLKQLIYSFDYDFATGVAIWDFQWYAFPFQFCTTPIFVSIICLFLKKNKIRDSLLSYVAFFTIWGSIMTMLMPDSCLTTLITGNIHTMWLHFGSFVVSIYLIMSDEVLVAKRNIKGGIITFLIFVLIANTLNITIYNSGILNGEEFNMFYISPYFVSELPVFNIVQEAVIYPVFLFFYTAAIIIGAFVIYGLSYVIKKNIIKSLTAKKEKSYVKN